MSEWQWPRPSPHAAAWDDESEMLPHLCRQHARRPQYQAATKGGPKELAWGDSERSGEGGAARNGSGKGGPEEEGPLCVELPTQDSTTSGGEGHTEGGSIAGRWHRGAGGDATVGRETKRRLSILPEADRLGRDLSRRRESEAS